MNTATASVSLKHLKIMVGPWIISIQPGGQSFPGANSPTTHDCRFLQGDEMIGLAQMHEEIKRIASAYYLQSRRLFGKKNVETI